MSHDILKRLGLDHLDATSPDFLRALEQMQHAAWASLQDEDVGMPMTHRGTTNGGLILD